MSTDDCKDFLVEEYSRTVAADWKRISKKTYDGEVWRTFANAKSNLTVIINDDEDYHEVGEMYFAVYEVDGKWNISFAAKSFWEKNGCLPDQHWGDLISHIYGINMSDLRETQENVFVLKNAIPTTKDDLIARLTAPNLSHNQDFTDYLIKSWS